MTANVLEKVERSSPIDAASADYALARCISRILGTLPEDAVDFASNDPLRSVHAAIASHYDQMVARILVERGIKDPQPVTPAVALPLLRAAYDETRPELQKLWARLIAMAMDPARAHDMRKSFIEALSRLDPLDARVLTWMPVSESGPEIINFADRACKELSASPDEIQLSCANLAQLRCIEYAAHRPQHPVLAPFGRKLLSACAESDDG